MTSNPNKPHENTGNKTTVHNPDAPGQIEKVNPTTGDTTTENVDAKLPGAK